jgi:hypothetical protein
VCVRGQEQPDGGVRWDPPLEEHVTVLLLYTRSGEVAGRAVAKESKASSAAPPHVVESASRVVERASPVMDRSTRGDQAAVAGIEEKLIPSAYTSLKPSSIRSCTWLPWEAAYMYLFGKHCDVYTATYPVYVPHIYWAKIIIGPLAIFGVLCTGE